jgi:predicted metal-dependent hydrolase
MKKIGKAALRRYSFRSFPPYSYVPGFAPHPVSDPAGHLYGQAPERALPLAPDAWRASEVYLYAVDLFNHGFFWEAHEAWESLWHAAGRRGRDATWLKSLIKLAAAGVKAREGNASGVQRHARRALELLGEVRRELPAATDTFCGLSLDLVELIAQELRDAAPESFAEPRLDWRLGRVLIAAAWSSAAR